MISGEEFGEKIFITHLKLGKSAESTEIVSSRPTVLAYLLNCAIIYTIWRETNSSFQMERFFTQCFPIAFRSTSAVVHVSEGDNFFHHAVGNLPSNATEIVRFLKIKEDENLLNFYQDHI